MATTTLENLEALSAVGAASVTGGYDIGDRA
jgi:hypothetical protein